MVRSIGSRTRHPVDPQLDIALRHEAVDLRVAVLRALAEGSSIAQAARSLGMSYRAAWQALDTLTNLAGVALVERAVGGSGGGGSRLTAAGTQVLHASSRLEAARLEALASLTAAGRDAGLPGPGVKAPAAPGAPVALQALGLRTSMRNVCHAVVEAVRPGRPTAQVLVRVCPSGGATGQPGSSADADSSCGPRVEVHVTRESAELLGLEPGVRVLLLCKAVAIRIERDDAAAAAGGRTRPPRAPAHTLAGKVQRVARATPGALSREATVELRDAAGVRFVGLHAAAQPLRRGQAVLVHADPASLILALPA